MNGTMQVDPALHVFGSRTKRIKTENPRDGNNAFVNATNKFPLGGAERPAPLQITSVVNTLPRPAEPPLVIKENPTPSIYSSHIRSPMSQASPNLTNSNGPAPYLPVTGQPPLFRTQSSATADPGQTRPSIITNIQHLDTGIPFKHPAELVWWLAANFNRSLASLQNGQGIMDPNSLLSASSNQMTGALPQIAYHEVDAAAEKDRLRQENRVRKQRWRQDNAERNKDNDLRCRVNKIAKQKYGPQDSVEKAQFIENEFQIRRQKREAKQRNRAQQSGTLPTFNSNSGLASDARPSIQSLISPAVQAAHERGIKILRLLGSHPRDQQLPPNVYEEAQMLVNDIEKGIVPLEALAEAARTSSMAEQVARPLQQSPLTAKGSETQGSTSGEDESLLSAQPLSENIESLGSGLPIRPQVQFPSSNPSFSDMANDRSYASPYGVPDAPTAPAASNVVEEDKGKAPMRDILASPETISIPSKRSSPMQNDHIDALIQLADVSDDEEGDELRVEQTGQSPVTKSAAVVKKSRKLSKTARSKIKARATRLLEKDGSRSDSGSGRNTPGFEKVLAEAEIPVNTIVPVAKAHAASKFAPRDGPATRGKSVRISEGSSTAEDEQKKVRRYGFPPLPGMNGKSASK